MDYAVHGILQARILGWVVIPFSRGSSQPGIEPRSLAVQADSLPTESPGAGGLGSIPGLGRSPREGNGYPLQYSGLENSMDCIVHGVAESDTTEQLSLCLLTAEVKRYVSSL